MPIAQSSGIGAVRDFSPPSVQIVKLRKPCELDGRIDRLFEIDAFRMGWRQRLRAGNPASHINPSPAKDVELEKRTYSPSWIGFTCTTRVLVQLAGSPFREPVSTNLTAKLLLQLQASI